ncbi:ParB N-terminal domain-containing protein [Frateuria aurantia]
MDILINEALRAYIDPLTAEEYEALERSLLAEGCRDALVLWGNVLVDGHNRYAICSKHGIQYRTIQMERFQSLDDVHLWMIEQHLGRRSVSDFQRGVLALRKRDILATRSEPEPAPSVPAAVETPAGEVPWDESDTTGVQPLGAKERELIAREAKISRNQVGLIEKIQRQAAPEVIEAVRAGTLSINAAAAVATLPEQEQKAAAEAGRDELRQAAKRVREARRRPPKAVAGRLAEGDEDAPLPPHIERELRGLRLRVAELTDENEQLKAQIERLRQHQGTSSEDSDTSI